MNHQIDTDKLTYYPIQKRWQRLKGFYRSEEATTIWKRGMELYDVARSAQYGYTPRSSKDADVPNWFETCDWQWNYDKPGPWPSYWDFVCHGACHYLVDLNLYIAQKAAPKKEWRIITSDLHSTVWDGEHTLFDANYQALGVEPEMT